MPSAILTWTSLAIGAALSAYLDVSLAGQPEQLWLPVLNMVAFATISGMLIEI